MVAVSAFALTSGEGIMQDTVVSLPGEEPMPREGVEGFTLDECVRYAVYNSFEVKLAKLDFYIAETDKLYSEAIFDTILFGEATYSEDKRQQLSVFAPDDTQTNEYSLGMSKELLTGTEIKATWEDTRQWTNTIFVDKNPSHNAQLSLEFTQPVGENFFGYIDRTKLTVTELAIKNADLETKERIEKLIARVENDYWELVYARRAVDINEDLLEKANRLHDTNARNYDLGVIERGDFLASEANVLIREKDVLLAKNTYKRAEENLKLLMNMSEPYPLYALGSFNIEQEKFDLVECLKTAFENRRDYKVRKRDIKIKNLNLKMKANAQWPEIDLKGTLAMNGLEGDFKKAFGKTTVADNTYYYAGVEFSMPLENSEARSEYQKASFEKEKAVVDLKEVERTIITQVGNSFRNVSTLNITVVNMTEAARLQGEKLEEEAKRFKYGRSTTKTLIDYMNDLQNAEMSQVLELLAREKARITLEDDMDVILDKYGDII